MQYKGQWCLCVPVVFVGKSVEEFLFLMYHVLQAFIDWCTAVANLLQHSLKDYHITNHRVFQHVNLQDTESINIRLKRIGAVQNQVQMLYVCANLKK